MAVGHHRDPFMRPSESNRSSRGADASAGALRTIGATGDRIGSVENDSNYRLVTGARSGRSDGDGSAPGTKWRRSRSHS